MLRPFTRLGTTVFVALALLAALPAAVMAQGSGDEQYADPFGDLPDESGQTPQEQPAPPEQQTTQLPSDGVESTGAPDSPTQPAPEETVAGESNTAAAGSDEQLARTGQPAGLLLLIGSTLLSAGMLLHMRLGTPQGP